jgi:hypothetical protein
MQQQQQQRKAVPIHLLALNAAQRLSSTMMQYSCELQTIISDVV